MVAIMLIYLKEFPCSLFTSRISRQFTEASSTTLLHSIQPKPCMKMKFILTVGAVRYNAFGRYKEGAASSFLSDRIEEEHKIPVYIKQNEGFRLPEDPSTKIIMVGPGTGVAPFRAFVDERAEQGNAGDSWLFFGNPHFTTDFLYQTEWLEHIKNETLTRLNVAFSRDQKNKIYVQHKIKEHGKDLYDWIQDNATIYVCGDKNYMAKDVELAFRNIIKQYGNTSDEEAQQFIKNLKREERYQEDVY
jgi:sulfite reductase (NADPH) flavoprotein alpha-component